MNHDDNNDDEPLTADAGRIVLDSPNGADVWFGRVLAPREREVVIVYRFHDYERAQAALDQLLRFESPGVAPLVYLGVPDRRRFVIAGLPDVAPEVVMAELRPEGTTLFDAGRLSVGETVRLGIELCDTIFAWGGPEIFGLHPQTVYVAGELGQRRFAAVTPRVHYLAGGDGSTAFVLDDRRSSTRAYRRSSRRYSASGC